VPHPARGGGILQALDPDRSVLPLALSGVLVDYRDGVRRGFQDAYAAGFNSVMPDPDQPEAAVRAAAEGSRVLVLSADDDDGFPQRLEAYGAVLVPVANAADLDRLATAVRDAPDPPVWALLRAHADASHGVAMPDPATARMLAFGALASGASGLVWQGEDNYAARNAGMLGIAATPSLDYGIRTNPDRSHEPYRASPDDVAASRRLWDTVTQLNRRIERLAPMLLRPDDGSRYTIGIAGDVPPGPPPLRSLLKPWDGDGDPRRLLLVVNTGGTARDFVVGFSRPFRRIERWQDDDPEPPDADASRGRFRDRVAAQGVRLYRISD